MSFTQIRNRNIFITGGAGFIGTKLATTLIKSNRITIYDNLTRDALSQSEITRHPNLTFIEGDVLNYDKLAAAMEGAEIVIHAAAIAGIDRVIIDPVSTMRINITGTANCLEAARVHGVSERFLNFSTSEVLGSRAFKCDETSDTVSGSAGEGRWTYAVSKLAGEHLAKAYWSQYKLPVVCIRPFNIYGPGQVGSGAVKTFVELALKDEDILINGDGNQIRAWCYIDDFIEGLLLCLGSSGAVGEVFNIGNARAVVTTYGLAQAICRTLQSKSQIRFVPALSADVELRIPAVDKALEILGFKAHIDLEEGIEKTARWLRGVKNGTQSMSIPAVQP